jgi:hypothetical protein
MRLLSNVAYRMGHHEWSAGCHDMSCTTSPILILLTDPAAGILCSAKNGFQNFRLCKLFEVADPAAGDVLSAKKTVRDASDILCVFRRS